MYWVYILKNDKNRLYIGYTGKIAKRLSDHNEGRSYWTSRFKNWRLVYYEPFRTRTEAIIREKILKTGKGRDELRRKNII